MSARTTTSEVHSHAFCCPDKPCLRVTFVKKLIGRRLKFQKNDTRDIFRRFPLSNPYFNNLTRKGDALKNISMAMTQTRTTVSRGKSNSRRKGKQQRARGGCVVFRVNAHAKRTIRSHFLSYQTRSTVDVQHSIGAYRKHFIIVPHL